MFPFDYINAHWHDLGSDHFIAFCIGINIALLGWPAFQDRLRYAGRQLNPLLSSVSASILDQERSWFSTLTKKFLKTVVFLHRWGWRTIDALALGAVIVGASMLYLKKSCPYDFLLLLPMIIHVGLSFMIWWIVAAWSTLLHAGMRIFGMRIFGPQIPSPTTAKNTVADFALPAIHENEHLAGQIISQPRAGPGHRHRSSDNFSIDVPSGCYGLRWECPPGIKFSIKQAPQFGAFGAPSIVFLKLSKGSKTKPPPGGARDRFYVADPVGCQSEFEVRAIALCGE